MAGKRKTTAPAGNQTAVVVVWYFGDTPLMSYYYLLQVGLYTSRTLRTVDGHSAGHKIPCFYIIWMSFTIFTTKSHHWILFWAGSMQPSPSRPLSNIHFNFIHVLSNLPTYPFLEAFGPNSSSNAHFTLVYYLPQISHYSSFNYLTNIRRRKLYDDHYLVNCTRHE
jgi:hypothetical protein